MTCAPAERGCGGRLPWAPRPYRDELLWSWRTRVAARYGLTPIELQAWLIARTRPGDPAPSTAVESAPCLDLWARAARIDPERLRRMILSARYPGRPEHWILQEGCPDCHWRRPEPPVCFACLADDGRAGRDDYLRAAWMRAEVCACPRHGVLLADACLACARPLRTAGWFMRGRRALACAGCGAALGQLAGVGSAGASPALFAAQRWSRELVDGGAASALDEKLSGLWRRFSRARSRPEIERWMDWAPPWPLQDRCLIDAPRSFSLLSVETRAILLQAVAGWPILVATGSTTATGSPGFSRAAAQTVPRPRIRLPGIAHYRALAEGLLADPAWLDAARLPEGPRRRAEAGLMAQALRRRPSLIHDSLDAAKAPVQRGRVSAVQP